MTEIVITLDIERPVETVREYLTELHHTKDWSTTVVDTVYSGPIRLGAAGVETRRTGRRELKMMNWEVTGYDPPRFMALTFGPPLNSVALFSFVPIPTGGTRFTCSTTIKPKGSMRLLAPIIAVEGRRADEKQFAKAKAIMEAKDVGGGGFDDISR